MLIKVFGIWLMASNIAFLEPSNSKCSVQFINVGSSPLSNAKWNSMISVKYSCDEVAAEINKQLKEG